MDSLGQVLQWIERLSGVLSVVSFAVALWAAWGVRRLNNAWRNLLRIQELRDELTDVASRISTEAPNVVNDQEVMLGCLSDAEAVLISLKGSIGGRFLFWSTRRRLVLEIEKVRVELNRYREKDYLNVHTASEAYRRISQVALMVGHHVQDQRLER